MIRPWSSLEVGMVKLKLTEQNLGRVFNYRSGSMFALQLLCTKAMRSNLKLKTRPKQLLGSLPLETALPGIGDEAASLGRFETGLKPV